MAAYEKYLPVLPEEILELRAEMELDYLQQDLPRTMASIRNGADRLKKLVSSLQNAILTKFIQNLHICTLVSIAPYC